MRDWTKARIHSKVTAEKMLIAACNLLVVNLLLYSFWRIDIHKNLLRIGAVALCGAVYLLRSKVRLFDGVCLLLAVYLIAVRGAASINLAFMVILAIALGWLDQRKLLKALHKAHVFLVIVVAASLALGLAHNETLQVASRTRNTLGFAQVNYAGLLSYSLFSVYLLSRQTVRCRNLLWTAAASLALFLLTDSRTGFMGVIVMMLAFGAFQMLRIRWSKRIAMTGLVFAFASPFLWQLPFLNSRLFNSLLSNRPVLFTEYIRANTAVNLIIGGSRVREIDSFYLLLLYNAGIVIYLLVGIIAAKAVMNMLDRGRKIEAAFAVSTLAVALFESSLLRPEIPCMCFFWQLVLRESKPALSPKRISGMQMVTGKR